MSKVAQYLQEHLVGEVLTSVDARKHFSTDASILQQPPALIVYPRNENDVRKTARFTWQLAERGRVIPITPRGSGTDQTGAAIGQGIMMVFPAHANRILELDTKTNTVTVEPGINFGKLQQTLLTHNRHIPVFPSSIEYSTVGGAVANNASGDRSVKYGDLRGFIQKLRVVLANGEVMETGQLGKRELAKKLGLATFEGEIYRSIDALFEEHGEDLEKLVRTTAYNNSGYCIDDVRKKDGSIDLTPLFVGSQGTLGIISEIVLETEGYNPNRTLQYATFDSIISAQSAALELRNLSDIPSAIEFIDSVTLQAVAESHPNLLKNTAEAPYPAITLFVEYDSASERAVKKSIKKSAKIFEKYALSLHTETDVESQGQLWQLRQATAAFLAHAEGTAKAVPVLTGVCVPVHELASLYEGTSEMLRRHGFTPAIWGSAGDGVVHVYPRVDIGQVGDRQKLFKCMDEFFALVITLGGSVGGAYNDGRIRAPYLEPMYGPETFTLLHKIKTIFDPYGTLNPGVKVGTTHEALKSMLRTNYSLEHLYDHLPRS